jgi:uncharacterized protein Veg
LAPKTVLADIKKDLEAYVGARIRLKANRGRKRVLEREGVLEGTYPNIFIVKLEEANQTERRVSYSYSDLLTEAVELVVCGNTGLEHRFGAAPR